MRLNRGFVAALRRHFLHWRAVAPAQRERMYDEAAQRLRSQVMKETASIVQHVSSTSMTHC